MCIHVHHMNFIISKCYLMCIVKTFKIHSCCCHNGKVKSSKNVIGVQLKTSTCLEGYLWFNIFTCQHNKNVLIPGDALIGKLF